MPAPASRRCCAQHHLSCHADGKFEQEAAFCFHEQGATAHALKRGQLENNAGVYWTKSDCGLSRDAIRVYAAEFVRA